MLLAIPDVLTAQEVAHCRKVLEETQWVDGKVTAGPQSARAKYNLQIPEDAPAARQIGEIILSALGRSSAFITAALPLRVYPPLFNRYDVGMNFDAHVDNSIRFVRSANVRLRTDVSSTLFLSNPDEYDGGELVIEDTYGSQSVKLPAGHMIVYPATSLHRVNPITRGSRWASFFWSQSMVKDDGKRRQLYDLDQAITGLRGRLGDEDPAVLALANSYHNLLRGWAEM